MSLEICRREGALGRYKKIRRADWISMRSLMRWRENPQPVYQDLNSLNSSTPSKALVPTLEPRRQVYPFPQIARGVQLLQNLQVMES